MAGLHALRDEYSRTLEAVCALAAEALTPERVLSAECGVQNAEWWSCRCGGLTSTPAKPG